MNPDAPVNDFSAFKTPVGQGVAGMERARAGSTTSQGRAASPPMVPVRERSMTGPTRGRSSPTRRKSPPRQGALSGADPEDIMNPQGHNSKWWFDHIYSGRREIYLTPPFGLEFPADCFGEELIVHQVQGETARQACRHLAA